MNRQGTLAAEMDHLAILFLGLVLMNCMICGFWYAKKQLPEAEHYIVEMSQNIRQVLIPADVDLVILPAGASRAGATQP